MSSFGGLGRRILRGSGGVGIFELNEFLKSGGVDFPAGSFSFSGLLGLRQ